MADHVAVISNWSILVENFNTSALDFYKSVEEGMARRKVPDVTYSRTDMKEGGVLSAKREYLVVQRGKLMFAVCCAPYGTGQFFSWWLLEQLPRFTLLYALAFLAFLPILLVMTIASAGIINGTFLFVLVVFGGLALFKYTVLAETPEWEATLIAVPFFGPIYEKLFRPTTYYVVDTRTMFQESVRQAVREAIDNVTNQQGRRALALTGTDQPA